MRRKCVVVHAGARDHYQLALALVEKNYLEKLVTELYCPDYLTGILPGLARKRYQRGIPSSKVSLAYPAFWASTKMVTRNGFDLNQGKDISLSKKAYKVARDRGSHLFCYSYYAAHSFSQPPAFDGQKKLLFQLHPHPLSVKKLLEEELVLTPHASNSLFYENELQYPKEYFDKLSMESQLADKIVVASNYTRKTMIENGVSDHNITEIPYGINERQFRTRTIEPSNENLRIIFVGSMVQRKGLSYLLEAISCFKSKEVELVLCGRGFVDQALINHYSGTNVTIKRNINSEALVAELHRSDLFVLPALSEGFAHVILEAMSAGLPVMTTDHSCGPDIITEGKEGWMLPIRSSGSIVEKLQWCIDNKSVLFGMGQAASETASRYTWQKFRRGIIDFYESATPAL